EHGTFRRMRRVYVVNEKATEDYRRRWPDVADRISFLPNWYDHSIFRRLAPPVRDRLRRDLRDELGVPAGDRVLLFAGRLEGQKAPLLLVDAFVLLASAVTDVVLVICGDGSMRPAVAERARAAGEERRVRIVGTLGRERLAEVMSASDALVISSEFETGPTVGYEALATGLPVVTTPVGQISRIVRSSGAGTVSEDHTARALAAAMEEALRLPATVRDLASAASTPYAAATVLGEVYGYERALAAGLRGGVDP
ncbi:MAG TPA: glycosyltransferase family 4 protein, partial [Candidatus Limnocylindria bacterium]